MTTAGTHVVDTRIFLLGLDEMYRRAMQTHERGELLTCARRVAGVLRVAPADVPIEGYYTESPQLTEYFRLVRALQRVTEQARPSVDGLPEFRRLFDVMSAPIFGQPHSGGMLFPAGRDPLSQALGELWPQWAVAALTSAARRAAEASDDFSLVGLAARAGEPVVLAAVRESVVLYAAIVAGASLNPPKPTYVWEVDPGIARQAARFIATFNALFGEALPPAEASQAARYWHAGTSNDIVGRCVRIGADDAARPIRYYHWAVCRGADWSLTVQEFWSPEVWTTAQYRSKMRAGRCPEL
jgi:hypothetical protein